MDVHSTPFQNTRKGFFQLFYLSEWFLNISIGFCGFFFWIKNFF